jgi:hypothetical protein
MKREILPGSLLESHLFGSIRTLFRGDERLTYFFFHHMTGTLRLPPDELLREARELSRGERILIQIALDFWSDSGKTRLPDILDHLDDENLLAVIRAILRKREMDLYVTLEEEPPCFD